jgi:NADH:ubiquinone reductase (non-electrogenic)
VGSQPNTFGIPGVQEHALFLKEAEDSAKLHARLLGNLEKAAALSYQGDRYKAEIDRLLKVIVVGGGPTGMSIISVYFTKTSIHYLYIILYVFID